LYIQDIQDTRLSPRHIACLELTSQFVTDCTSYLNIYMYRFSQSSLLMATLLFLQRLMKFCFYWYILLTSQTLPFFVQYPISQSHYTCCLKRMHLKFGQNFVKF